MGLLFLPPKTGYSSRQRVLVASKLNAPLTGRERQWFGEHGGERVEVLLEKLQALELVDPVESSGLQAFGLRWTADAPLDYLTLDDALAAKVLSVTEVDEGGRVPTLLVSNDSNQMVFLMAGEQLIGAKQNRVLNASIMVKARSKLVVPVSCVERGRWGYRSRAFSGSGTASHGTLRRMMSRQAHQGYRSHRTPSSQQGQVWGQISEKLAQLGSVSSSDALEQVYEDHRARLDAITREVRVPDDCHGVVFALGGRVAGVDLFDNPKTLSKLLPKLVRAYAIDAIVAKDAKNVDRDAVTAWLKTAPSATAEVYDSPGLGSDVRLESQQIAGAALVVDDHAIHVELFPAVNPEHKA